MEREHEAITSPDHYKVCEGLEVVEMIRAVLTPEQFRGYCLGNLIQYRMRAGKKTMSPMGDLGKAHVYETWLKEMEGGEGGTLTNFSNTFRTNTASILYGLKSGRLRIACRNCGKRNMTAVLLLANCLKK
jgi:hypothetical protein